MDSLSSTIFISLASLSSSFPTYHYYHHQHRTSLTILSSSTPFPHLRFPLSSFSSPPPPPPAATTNSNPSSNTRATTTTCSSRRRRNHPLPLANPCFKSLFGYKSTTSDFLNCNAIITANGNSEGETAEEGSVVVVRGMIRFMVAAVACACLMFVSRCQRAVAAENTKGGLSLVKGLVGPKTIQVLHVLKDRGLILAALLGLSAFFSMAETAITTLWPWKVRELAEKEPENGVFRMLCSDVTRFLTTILIGTTVLNIAATALVTGAATTIFGEAGVSAATGVMTVAILLLTEITPKSIAVHNATEVARFVARPVAWLSLVLYPVGQVVTFLSMGMLKMLGLKGRSEPYVTEDELKLMLRGAELSGAIEEEEQDMIENVLEIKDTHVREVMTPLVDVVAIDASATLIDFQKSWETHQYSRVPVFEARIDNIIGIAYAMDMLEYIGKAEKLKEATVREIAHPTYFVPDSMSVWNLLREFRIRKVHMAVVLNEYGGTVGIVTLEDIVEEIVGEIFDENDSKEEIQKKTGYIVMQEDGTFDVDANTSIYQLSEELDVKIPEGHQYETVSGFICESFGYIPEEGAKMVVLLERANLEGSNEYADTEPDSHDEKAKHQTFELEVLEANERKVGKVRFKPRNSGGNPDVEKNKGLSRLLSTKVVKRKKQQQNNREMEGREGNNDTADILEEGSRSNPEGRLEDDSNCGFGTVEEGDGYNIVSRQ